MVQVQEQGWGETRMSMWVRVRRRLRVQQLWLPRRPVQRRAESWNFS